VLGVWYFRYNYSNDKFADPLALELGRSYMIIYCIYKHFLL
jgi:hypothetical protein